jgi:glyoxylase-like metal-dependent hydrolase (beta-lactamase superfamily II)
MTYGLYAIKYAEHARTARANFIGGDPHDGPMPMDYFVWLIRDAKRSILVDTGFTRDTAARRGRRFLRCPSDTLRALGVEPDAITDVIVTHLHYDHAGNFGLFPNATFHVQDLEMQFATGRHMCERAQRESYEADDVMALVREVHRGRVRFHDGTDELAPDVRLHLVGGHTLGLQVVTVGTARGCVVVASDASHYYANMLTRRPFPIVYDVEAMVCGWDRLQALAESPDHVVPGHDPEVLRRYPLADASLPGVARLDRAPVRMLQDDRDDPHGNAG